MATGSAMGAVARHVVSGAADAFAGWTFPWGTLAVNVLGSFVIGLYATITGPDGRLMASPEARLFVMAGLCGGLTTFSIFSLETLLLLVGDARPLATLNATSALLLWIPSAWGGHAVARHLNRLGGRYG